MNTSKLLSLTIGLPVLCYRRNPHCLDCVAALYIAPDGYRLTEIDDSDSAAPRVLWDMPYAPDDAPATRVLPTALLIRALDRYAADRCPWCDDDATHCDPVVGCGWPNARQADAEDARA